MLIYYELVAFLLVLQSIFTLKYAIERRRNLRFGGFPSSFKDTMMKQTFILQKDFLKYESICLWVVFLFSWMISHLLNINIPCANLGSDTLWLPFCGSDDDDGSIFFYMCVSVFVCVLRGWRGALKFIWPSIMRYHLLCEVLLNPVKLNVSTWNTGR